MAPMAQKAQEFLGSQHLQAVADSGYFNPQHLKDCLEAGITPYVPQPDRYKAARQQGRFSREDFVYHPEQDFYVCSAGQVLRHNRTYTMTGRLLYGYASQAAVCAPCEFKTKCLPKKNAIAKSAAGSMNRLSSTTANAWPKQAPKIPSTHSRLPSEIAQLHTADYRNASALPSGAIVIVGSGQSGCQIAEDLLTAGRTVYLCISEVGRAPRRYRGRDIFEWWLDMEFMDVSLASLEDKSISRAAQPQISGLGRYGHTISLQQLARQGVVILGRLLDVNTGTLVLGDEAAAHVRFADEFSQRLKDGVDA
jgi:hypothetical protein